MKQKKNNYRTLGVFLGRISPIHKGHQAVIDKMISDFGVKNCLLIIGSSNSYNERTPYTFGERKKMVRILYPAVRVLGFPDTKPEKLIFDPEMLSAWLERLKKLENSLHAKFIFYGGSGKDLSYLGNYFNTKVVVNREIAGGGISATKIRSRLKKKDVATLQKYLDPKIIKIASDGYANFQETVELVQKYTDEWNPEDTKPLRNFSTQNQISILGIPDKKTLENINRIVTRLKKIDPGHTYYGNREFHLTLIGRIDPQLVPQSKFPEIKYLIKKYSLDFKMKGFYGNRSGLYVVCLPNFDISELRNELRNLVKSHGKEFDEMAEKVGWICILRYAKKPAKKFLDFINENKYRKEFGDLTINKINVYKFNNILFKRDKNTVKLFGFTL